MTIRGVHRIALLVITASFLGCGGSGGGGAASSEPVNSSPNAVITVDSTTGHSPFAVSFSASQSTDSDGSISSYSWDFGDGGNATTSQADHTYTDLGIFSAILTVTDNDGSTGTASVSIKVHAQVAGYYWGSITSNVTFQNTFVEVIVGTNGKMFLWDYVAYDTAYWGDYNISESIVSGTLNAQVWNPAGTFADGTQFGSITFSADVVARQSITGTYTGVGDSGPLDVVYLPEISDAPLSFTELSGDWTYSDGAGYTDTLTITSAGALSITSSDGCTGSGQLTEMDTSINGYEFDLDLQCPAGVINNPNGVRSGIAFLDDHWFADTWIVFAGAIGNDATHVGYPRPRPVASAGGGNFAPESSTSSKRLRTQSRR